MFRNLSELSQNLVGKLNTDFLKPGICPGWKVGFTNDKNSISEALKNSNGFNLVDTQNPELSELIIHNLVRNGCTLDKECHKGNFIYCYQ